MSPVGSTIWNNQILFRNYMIKHPEELENYILLKKRLAQKYPEDRESYSQGKAAYILHILDLAIKENNHENVLTRRKIL